MISFLTLPFGLLPGGRVINNDERSKMTREQTIHIRQEILAAAVKAGVKNANQFGDLAVKTGIMVKSHAVQFYNGTSDITTGKADRWLKYFAKAQF